jgi:hypothetical protein
VTVRNTGTAPIAGWQVTWALPAGQSVTQLWNGGYTVASGTVTVTNANWNGALAAGATATFGLTGSGGLRGPSEVYGAQQLEQLLGVVDRRL